MKTLWRIALYEYRRNVFKKSFVFVLLSVPFFIVFAIGLIIVMEAINTDNAPVGYVDHIGLLDASLLDSELRTTLAADYHKPVEFIAYATEEEARAALEAKSIQAFYVLPSDFMVSRRVEQVYIDKPGENVDQQFFDFLQVSILSSQSPDIAYRIAEGTYVTIRSVDGQRVLPDNAPPLDVLMPLFITMSFLSLIVMSSGYTVSAVADEKENRTMEVLITSISPHRLISGKILGIVGIGLTVLLTWALVAILAIAFGRQFGLDWFDNLHLDWRTVIATITLAIPTYALAIALMTAIGAMVTTVQEGQSVSGVFFILHFAPLYVSWAFLETPHNTLAVTLSLLPFTSLITIGMRNMFTIVPTWQIVASIIVQTVCAAGAMWLAGRALRLGMLRYGQRLNLGKLFGTNGDR